MSIIVVPRGTPHAQANLTDERVRVLITLSPSGFENFFVERASIVKEHPPGTEEYGMEMRRLGETYDIKLLGTSPLNKNQVKWRSRRESLPNHSLGLLYLVD